MADSEESPEGISPSTPLEELSAKASVPKAGHQSTQTSDAFTPDDEKVDLPILKAGNDAKHKKVEFTSEIPDSDAIYDDWSPMKLSQLESTAASNCLEAIGPVPVVTPNDEISQASSTKLMDELEPLPLFELESQELRVESLVYLDEVESLKMPKEEGSNEIEEKGEASAATDNEIQESSKTLIDKTDNLSMKDFSALEVSFGLVPSQEDDHRITELKSTTGTFPGSSIQRSSIGDQTAELIEILAHERRCEKVYQFEIPADLPVEELASSLDLEASSAEAAMAPPHYSPVINHSAVPSDNGFPGSSIAQNLHRPEEILRDQEIIDGENEELQDVNANTGDTGKDAYQNQTSDEEENVVGPKSSTEKQTNTSRIHTTPANNNNDREKSTTLILPKTLSGENEEDFRESDREEDEETQKEITSESQVDVPASNDSSPPSTQDGDELPDAPLSMAAPYTKQLSIKSAAINVPKDVDSTQPPLRDSGPSSHTLSVPDSDDDDDEDIVDSPEEKEKSPGVDSTTSSSPSHRINTPSSISTKFHVLVDMPPSSIPAIPDSDEDDDENLPDAQELIATVPAPMASTKRFSSPANTLFPSPPTSLKPEVIGNLKRKSPSPSLSQQPLTPGPQSKDILVAELKAIKIASIQARNASLEAEILEKKKKLEEFTNTLKYPAAETVRSHIKLLHDYNDIRDVGQGLVGMIADNRGVRIGDLYEEFGVGLKD